MVGEAPAHNEATGRGLYAPLTRWRSRRSAALWRSQPRTIRVSHLQKSCDIYRVLLSLGPEPDVCTLPTIA
jgi:hypothetical protein